jgi:predicted transcriptional regulator
MAKNLITSFRPAGTGLGKLFGELEAKVMDALWSEQEATARIVFEKLRDQGRRLSYSTVKTILERLVEKGVLEKELHAKAYVYRPLLGREEFTRSAVAQIIDSLLTSFADSTVTCFVDKLSTEHPERVGELLQLIEEASRDTPTQPDSVGQG